MSDAQRDKSFPTASVNDLRELHTATLAIVSVMAATLFALVPDCFQRGWNVLAIWFMAFGIFIVMQAFRAAIGYDARYHARVAATSASPVPTASHAARETASVDGGSR